MRARISDSNPQCMPPRIVRDCTTVLICPPPALDPNPLGLDETVTLRPTALPLADPPELPVDFANPDRPLVYVTLGTLQNNDIDLFRLVLDVLADEPVNVLVTVGRDNDPAMLQPVAANARVERFIPQAELLPRCSAAIHHAGAGTMFGLLAHGLPSVALPQGADNFSNAHLIAAAGAAEILLPNEVTADAVTARLRTVMAGESHRQRAALIADEMRAMGTPEQVAESLSDRRATRAR